MSAAISGLGREGDEGLEGFVVPQYCSLDELQGNGLGWVFGRGRLLALLLSAVAALRSALDERVDAKGLERRLSRRRGSAEELLSGDQTEVYEVEWRKGRELTDLHSELGTLLKRRDILLRMSFRRLVRLVLDLGGLLSFLEVTELEG